jgi:glucosamine-6-phosphate deaminase
MQVIIVDGFAELSAQAAEILAQAVRGKPDLVLGLASGATPEGLYRRLGEIHSQRALDFSGVRTFLLDEYVGLEPTDPNSFAYYMDEKFYAGVNVPAENRHAPPTGGGGLTAVCAAYEKAIREAGGIDLQTLGVGRNGHLGFNEPGTSLAARVHVTALAPETIDDNSRFFDYPEDMPRFGLTMGLGTIMDARTCLLLASGESKAAAVAGAVEGPITASLPASVLQMHPAALAIVDEAAASQLQRAEFYRHQRATWEQVSGLL